MFFPQDVFTLFWTWFLELSDFVLHNINLLLFISKLTVSYERTLFDFV